MLSDVTLISGTRRDVVADILSLLYTTTSLATPRQCRRRLLVLFAAVKHFTRPVDRTGQKSCCCQVEPGGQRTTKCTYRPRMNYAAR